MNEFPGRYHQDGHDTEIESAHAGLSAKVTQRNQILNRMRAVGSRGATDYENYEALGFIRPHVAATRRKELVDKLGMTIVDSGRRRPTDTGSNAIVWILEESRQSPFNDL